MAEKLDYAPAPEKQPETPADRVLKLVLIIGLAMLAITSLLLDGGRMFAISALLISILLIILSVISIATAPPQTGRFTALRIACLVVGLGTLALCA